MHCLRPHPPLVGTVKGLLNGVAGKCGVPETGNYLNGGIMVASIVSLLGGFGDSALIMKGVAGWWLLNGVGMFLAADKARASPLRHSLPPCHLASSILPLGRRRVWPQGG